jgi:hypothetical protein
MFLSTLPTDLENAEALLERRKKAATKKEMWRSTYQDAYRFAMPTRETFSWAIEGQNKQRQLYDSTLQESTYTAANTLCALLFPSWTRWAELAPGGAIGQDAVTPEIIDGLQKATQTFFTFLNNSNFGTVISEAALDLMIGTAALSFDEGDQDRPFSFSSIPLSAIEIEEGPDGSVETTWMCRKPLARHLMRLYPGLTLFDLSPATQDAIVMKPDAEIEIIQGLVYHPETKAYYGVVVEVAAKQIIWRYNYASSCPTIVARATKVAGETYGRGRVLLALADAKTLDKMQEFVLRHSAISVAPPMTGVSDGVLNPYTATLSPNTIIPVASNDTGNPSLAPIPIGGNFRITENLMTDLREKVRRIMLGPEPSEGAVKSATEISVSDRNRLWAMNGEYSRIQSELLAKIIARGIFILQKKGLMARFKVDGREVAVKYTSPFAKSQNAEDVMALQETLMIAGAMGPELIHSALRTEKMPGWIARMKGVPESLICSDEEQQSRVAQAAQAMAVMQQMQAPAQPGAPAGA